ncbi:tRNA (adenine(22)-N(1))-methyltransferase [Pontibacillus litoralis]|uniref:SAM-dependent methyltransferase n=1 Tax=Pontibacillus litoralis JSM 072002 TaxID=1385512 RepID=A0A0A5HZ67_9BACI|nr:tRNA (adenine(22)-N(1))-methyltransferase TrmK [Pontibacillus litoralis]KGX88902.1 SAM-dependent methyltransferase [Pontibacillus litoralis JSM 072002]
MNSLHLSKRLQVVASYLPNSAQFADIGSDHAYLPCYVCLQDTRARAIAGEVNEGPYQSAIHEVQQQGLQARIDVRKGDGLQVIKENEVEQLTIAGMGATLIASILEAGKHKLERVSRLIVQPNINAIALREWFVHNDYVLVAEEIVEEDGHFYEILVADRQGADQPYTEAEKDKEMYLGPFLMKQRSKAFIRKWEAEAMKLRRVIRSIQQADQIDEGKLKRFEQQLNWIEEAIQGEA